MLLLRQQTPRKPSAESTTVVENELYRITFSNRGAQVTSWILKKYKNDDGHPLDLVNHEAADKFGYPLSLFTYDQGMRTRLQHAMLCLRRLVTSTAPGIAELSTYSAGGLDSSQDIQVRFELRNPRRGLRHAKRAPVATMISWPAALAIRMTLPQ